MYMYNCVAEYYKCIILCFSELILFCLSEDFIMYMYITEFGGWCLLQFITLGFSFDHAESNFTSLSG